jgi:hypothetical protein
MTGEPHGVSVKIEADGGRKKHCAIIIACPLSASI